MRLRIVVRRTVKIPFLFSLLMCVKPRQWNVSGLPSLFVPGSVRQTAELDQVRLVWIEFQLKLPQLYPETLQKTICVCPMLES